jgi:phage major head subunit gpT-like protein
MLELIRQLFGQRRSDLKDLLPVLRAIIHSPALEEIVKASPNKADDLVLRVLRALIPAE